MIRIKRLTAISAAAAAVLVGACKESTSPTASDPSSMASTVAGFNSVLSQNAVFQSLTALSSSTVLAAPAVVPKLVPTIRGAAPAAEREVMLRLASRAPTAIQALFPANTLGKTFQWDTASGGHYRITDSALSGAPSSGVRFKLYQVDTATQQPRLPLATTGYMDLIDISNAQSNGIHLVLQVGAQTAADYTVTEVKTTSSLGLAAVGYVQDVVTSGPKVTFNLAHVLSLVDGSLETTYQATGNGATVTMATAYAGTSANESETFNWLLEKNGSVEVGGHVTADSTNVVFRLGGAIYATLREITGGQSTVTGPNGRALTTGEMLALLSIVKAFADVYVNLSLAFVPTLLFFT